jgi:hypothetical protein
VEIFKVLVSFGKPVELFPILEDTKEPEDVQYNPFNRSPSSWATATAEVSEPDRPQTVWNLTYGVLDFYFI